MCVRVRVADCTPSGLSSRIVCALRAIAKQFRQGLRGASPLSNGKRCTPGGIGGKGLKREKERQRERQRGSDLKRETERQRERRECHQMTA